MAPAVAENVQVCAKRRVRSGLPNVWALTCVLLSRKLPATATYGVRPRARSIRYEPLNSTPPYCCVTSSSDFLLHPKRFCGEPGGNFATSLGQVNAPSIWPICPYKRIPKVQGRRSYKGRSNANAKRCGLTPKMRIGG